MKENCQIESYQSCDGAKPDLPKNTEAQFAAFSLPTRSKVIEMAQ